MRAAVDIPVIANGDVTSPEGARRALELSGAAGVMVMETGNARGRLYGAEEPADLVDLTILAPKSCEEDCLLFEVEPMEFDSSCGFLVSWSLNDGDRSGSPGRVTAQRGTEVAGQVMSLPMSPYLGEPDQKRVAEALARALA